MPCCRALMRINGANRGVPTPAPSALCHLFLTAAFGILGLRLTRMPMMMVVRTVSYCEPL